MKLENAELKHIERIVAISKAAFDSDIHVGASELDAPPDYDSIAWHNSKFNAEKAHGKSVCLSQYLLLNNYLK